MDDLIPEELKSVTIKTDNKKKNDWDHLLSNTPEPLTSVPSRIEFNNVWVNLDNSSSYAQGLYEAYYYGTFSDWFLNEINKTTQLAHKKILKKFLIWIRTFHFTDKNTYQVLNQYQTYRINECGVKPQSTGLKEILIFLSNSTQCQQVSIETIAYIERIQQDTRLEASVSVVPHSLTGYLSTMPWLREALGERRYLQLESPRLLMRSFSVVVAATLEWIIKHKAIAKSRIGFHLPKIQQHSLKHHHDRGIYGQKLMHYIARLTDSQSDPTTELLLTDLANPPAKQILIDRFLQNDLAVSTNINGRRVILFQKPFVFASDHWDKPSKIEELLFSWLMAWLAVQPNDIPKLRRENIALIQNPSGRITELYVNYYKGRARQNHRTMSLSTREVEGRAILKFIQTLPYAQENLFSRNSAISFQLSFGRNSIPSTLVTLWQTPSLVKYLHEQLAPRKGSLLFLELMIALKQKGGQTFNSWSIQHSHTQIDGDTTSKFQKYLDTVWHSLNPNTITYTHIKTSAVQSRSDQYRMDNLVNENSHKSHTEKIAYLTDENKEWVNQNGRISRIVLKDMEQFVYRPNLNQAIIDAQEQILRTRIVTTLSDSTTDAATAHIDKLGRVHNSHSIPTRDASDILVLDTIETVVNMLHYTDQATKSYEQLIKHALVFFERTVLPNVEWMSVVLQQHLSPKIVSSGTKRYKILKPHLPPLFTSELSGGVST